MLLPGSDPEAVQAAAQRLADGELLGLRTVTRRSPRSLPPKAVPATTR
jgi:hypothetical protein